MRKRQLYKTIKRLLRENISQIDIDVPILGGKACMIGGQAIVDGAGCDVRGRQEGRAAAGGVRRAGA